MRVSVESCHVQADNFGIDFQNTACRHAQGANAKILFLSTWAILHLRYLVRVLSVPANASTSIFKFTAVAAELVEGDYYQRDERTRAWPAWVGASRATVRVRRSLLPAFLLLRLQGMKANTAVVPRDGMRL